MRHFALILLLATAFNVEISEAADPVCNANSSKPVCTFYAPNRNFQLKAGRQLVVGEMTYKMLATGDLVALDKDQRQVWAASARTDLSWPTPGVPVIPRSCAECFAIFNSDGNFVLKHPTSGSYWITRTNSSANSEAELRFLTRSPYIEIINPGGNYLWSTTGKISDGFVSSLPATDAMTWLTKSICVDKDDIALPYDPSGECPNGSRVRKIKPGEALPYSNEDGVFSTFDNISFTEPSGRVSIVNARQFFAATYRPDGRFRSHDQFDVYTVDPDWVSIPNTRAGGVFNFSFFGPDCKLGGGWRLFPTTNFLAGGRTDLTIAGQLWQKDGLSFPGDCQPFMLQTGTHFTKYEHLKDFKFGGMLEGQDTYGATTLKSLETIRVIHGYGTTEQFRNSGHLEVYYFTREYGLTRWEFWTPSNQLDSKGNLKAESNACVGLRQQVAYDNEGILYEQLKFRVTACQDGANRIVRNGFGGVSSAGTLPIFPVPNANLLKHANFDNGGGYFTQAPANSGSWYGIGLNPQNENLRMIARNSTYPLDINPDKVSAKGVTYLEFACGTSANATCHDTFSKQMLFQDIPVTDLPKDRNFAYGISARVRPDQTGTLQTIAGRDWFVPATRKSGRLRIGLQQLDQSYKVLVHKTFDVTVLDQDVSKAGRLDFKSVGQSSAFYVEKTNFAIDPNAKRVRFFIMPQDAETYEILEAWLAPW